MAGNFREYTSRSEMQQAGWTIASTNSECNRCGATITWSKSPKGKSVPLDANSTRLHFKTCSNGASAPLPGQPPAGNLAPASPPPTGSDFMALREALDECAQAVRALCGLLRARTEAAHK